MKKTFFFQTIHIAAAILIMVACTGCSTIMRYRGLSPQLNDISKKEDFKFDYHYEWKLSKYGANALNISSKKHRISILTYTNASEEQLLSIGPILLPIIPWPPGIYKAITQSASDAVIPRELLVYIDISGQVEVSNMQIDFSNVAIEIEPPTETKMHWQVQHWTDQTHYEFEPVHGITKVIPYRSTFRMTLSPISSSIRTLKIKFNDIKISEEKIDLPPIVFEKGSGSGMNPGVIND